MHWPAGRRTAAGRFATAGRGGSGTAGSSSRRSPFRSRPGVGAGAFGKDADSPAEDQAVHGVKRVPIDETRQPFWLEERRLDEPAAALAGGHLVLEPRAARHLHLSARVTRVRPTELLPSPEVERVAEAEMVRVGDALDFWRVEELRLPNV